MVAARLLFALLAMLLVVSGAHAAPAAPAAPKGLKAFLFRADEPVRREFARTPSFAWSPVPGAVRYEFELSTSNTFRENGLIYADRELRTPVASVMLTLPWITGAPYALYARVRAVLPRNAQTPWSAPFGFNMRQETVAKPLPSLPGLLRWTPIEGAGGYEVWMLDQSQMFTVYTNVLDLREAYTFHQSDEWISRVRWRIRSIRWDVSDEGGERRNGMPAASVGPWSPVYESTNPSFRAGDDIELLGTVSDVVSRGRTQDPAHRLMPAFAFSGDRALDGRSAELFRVYVFTDRDCINRVFTGSVVGSPAYAPRPYGALALPRTPTDLEIARGEYLGTGDQGTAYTFDGELVVPNEEMDQPTPTTGLPGVAPAATPAPSAPTTPGAPPTPSPPASGGSGSSSISFLRVSGDLGAPVDLWDTHWPQGGYYWTVVPVQAIAAGSQTTTTTSAATIGESSLTVASTSGFAPGDVLRVGHPSNQETVTVVGISGNVFTLAGALSRNHGAGEPVTRLSGNLTYRDLELPQEACASGRVMRFGKSSEPTLVASGAPFASGLSPRGRLTAAAGAAPSFYRSPLVAWTPALGADAYHVQWSRTRYPFRPQSVQWGGRGAAAGFLTFATSAVLPLQPGTWWYRVRGVSFHLPTNAQFMGWSEPTRLVVTRPVFTAVKTPTRR